MKNVLNNAESLEQPCPCVALGNFFYKFLAPKRWRASQARRARELMGMKKQKFKESGRVEFETTNKTTNYDSSKMDIDLD